MLDEQESIEYLAQQLGKIYNKDAIEQIKREVIEIANEQELLPSQVTRLVTACKCGFPKSVLAFIAQREHCPEQISILSSIFKNLEDEEKQDLIMFLSEDKFFKAIVSLSTFTILLDESSGGSLEFAKENLTKLRDGLKGGNISEKRAQDGSEALIELMAYVSKSNSAAAVSALIDFIVHIVKVDTPMNKSWKIAKFKSSLAKIEARALVGTGLKVGGDFYDALNEKILSTITKNIGLTNKQVYDKLLLVAQVENTRYTNQKETI